MIEATSSTTALPEDVLMAISSARDRVSILEAEAGRFERLITSQKRELVSLDGAFKDIQGQTDSVTEKKTALVKEVASLEEEKAVLLKETKKAEKKTADTKAEIDLQQEELHNKASNLTYREATLQKAEFALSEREKAVVADEFIVDEKKRLISELVTKL